MGEKEKRNSLSFMKRDGTRDLRVKEVASCRWPASLLGAMAKSYPMLLLRAMAECVATQKQGSVSIAHIPMGQLLGTT